MGWLREVAAAHSSRAVHACRVAAVAMRELAAVHRFGGRVCGEVGWSGCRECFVSERAQGVVAPAGELARDGEHCPLVTEAGSHGEVVVMVGGGGVGGADRGLEQTPPQKTRGLGGGGGPA